MDSHYSRGEFLVDTSFSGGVFLVDTYSYRLFVTREYVCLDIIIFFTEEYS
jgi:hypothetical protein